MSAPVQTYTVKLKTRRQLEAIKAREGYTEAWGWWVDVCPGKTLQLRDATAEDVARCYIRDGESRDPADWMCELFERGALVAKCAMSSITPNPMPEAAPAAPAEGRAHPDKWTEQRVLHPS